LVKLRLTRLGKKKQPFYRIVAIDSKSRRQGQTLAQIGTYDPVHAQVQVNADTAIEWLKQGAQMSETVEALLRSQGILARWRGFEGKVNDQILTKDKPARRRKLAAAQAEPEAVADPAAAAPAEAEPEAVSADA
jgi:small subunit ribosomal protein S16